MIERMDRLAHLLQDAILIAESSRERAVLRHLRVARSSLHEATDAAGIVRVDIFSGRVFTRGFPLALSRCELAVVLALALSDRGISRDVLAEDLYPGADPLRAANTLKVNVHRVRRRVGSPDVIRSSGGRYRLGEVVDVELPRVEADLRRFRVVERLTDEDRDRLERLRERVLDGRPDFVLEWPWFDETERRLRDIARDLTTLLARDALQAENFQRALELVAELGRDDPLDEVAAEIAIRALLLAGDRAAAVLHYRRYASVLRREVDSSPSRDLRALVDEV